MNRINTLQTWIILTVTRQYKDMYYKSDDSLRVWYKNLIKRVKPSVLQKHQAV